MSIVRCPRCRDEVTVPNRANNRALVRCPLCLEQYLLAEALAGAPPLLVIIGGEVEQAAIDVSADPGIEYTVAAGGLESAAFDPRAPATAAVMAPRPILRTSPRPRRKEQSGLSFLFSVVGGGLMAAPLALITLWWIFSVDPVELGPKIAQYAPWIVPPQFHGQPIDNMPPEDSSATAAVAPLKAQPKEMPEKLQTVPSLEEPARLPLETLTPAIEPPNLQEPESNGSLKAEQPARPAINRQLPKAEPPSDRPPMPDLTDLLPDGPTPQPEGQAKSPTP